MLELAYLLGCVQLEILAESTAKRPNNRTSTGHLPSGMSSTANSPTFGVPLTNHFWVFILASQLWLANLAKLPLGPASNTLQTNTHHCPEFVSLRVLIWKNQEYAQSQWWPVRIKMTQCCESSAWNFPILKAKSLHTKWSSGKCVCILDEMVYS